jgi:hypothetical protein
VVESVPVLLVETSFEIDGEVQPTSLLLTPTTGRVRETVGSPGELLHSRMLPVPLAVNPLPVTVTTEPLARPVEGDADMVAAA